MSTLDLLHLPVTLCETVTLAIFYKRFLGKRYNTKLPYIFGFAVYFVLNILLSIFIPDIVSILTITTCFILPFALYRGTKVQKSVCGGLLTAYLFASECSVMLVYSFVLQATVTEITENPFTFYFGAYVSKFLILVLVLVISSGRKSRLSPIPYQHNLILLFIVYICAGLSAADLLIVIRSGQPATFIHTLVVLATLLLSVLVFFVFEQFQAYAEREKHTAIVERQLVQDERRFRLIDEQNHEIRSIKHDMSNHLTSISKLAESKEYTELQKYLRDYLAEASPVMVHSITGKPSIDSLISEKLTLAESESVSVDLKINLQTEININAVHLNIILSNALDNSIEACRALSEGIKRYISLRLTTEDDCIYISIANSSSLIAINKGELPVTSKEDRVRHGLGLSAIKRLVDSYGGRMVCEYENGEFVLLVQMKNVTGDTFPPVSFRGF